MDDNQIQLERYIQRIIQLKEQHDGILSIKYLKEIAGDLGINWNIIHQALYTHLKNGFGYLKQGNYNDAIYELKKAEELSPNNSDALFYLMQAFHNRSKENDHLAAIGYGQKYLQINPGNEFAIKTVSSIKKRISSEHQLGRVILFLAPVIISIAMYFWGGNSGGTSATTAIGVGVFCFIIFNCFAWLSRQSNKDKQKKKGL